MGTIFTDSICYSNKNVKYSVENYRAEQKTDYEKLIFEIITDGSINPQDALTQAQNSYSSFYVVSMNESH